MIRQTNSCAILKKDLYTGLVKKQVHKNAQGEFLEYWVYQLHKYGLLNYKGTNFENPDSAYLKCIVVCENNPQHIVKEDDNSFRITGMRFDAEEMVDYLKKTGRSL